MNFDFKVLIPEIIVLVTAAIVLFGNWFVASEKNNPGKKANTMGLITLIGLMAAFGTTVAFKTSGYSLVTSYYAINERTFWSTFSLDQTAIYFKMIILLSAIFTVMISIKYVSEKLNNQGEFFSLLCMATLGALFLASANEMITFYLGIELLSISSFVLAGFNKAKAKSSEASLKYFVVGGLSSALMLYGFSIIFGLTGSTRFTEIAPALERLAGPNMSTLLIISLVLALAGIGYKIAVAPFHMWAPDVYEGAPVPVTAFLSVTSKIAGFAALIRFLEMFTVDIAGRLAVLVAILSIITMTVGNILSLAQKNIKRLFAYSSIAHAGYLLVGIVPMLVKGNTDSYAGVLFYLLVYIFMNIGCFAAIIYFSKHTGSTEISDLSGVASKAPFIAFIFSCCLISLTGLPPFGGFTGKFYLFISAVNAGYTWLALAGAINSVISMYYYVKIIKTMYFSEKVTKTEFEIPSAALAIACLLSFLGLVVSFVLPAPFMELAKSSILGL